MSDLTLYQLAPSPNSIKVRLALASKGLDYETVDLGFEDRAKAIEVSGQPLAPVLVDRDRSVYDSYGIMRYLDANWPENGPRLFSADREAMRAIEDWEMYARVQLGECMMMVVGPVMSGNVDPDALAKAREIFGERLRRVENALAERDTLMGGEAYNAADLTVAPFASYGFVEEAQVPAESIDMIFAKFMRLDDEAFPNTKAWVGRTLGLEKKA
jgi:glutathione S-transferase